MNINKISIFMTIILLILIIGIPTTYKVIKNHNQNLYRVVEEKVLEKAKECYYDKKCLNEKTTLKELYQNNYLEKVSDPISKEYYNENSYVERKDNQYKFIIVE